MDDEPTRRLRDVARFNERTRVRAEVVASPLERAPWDHAFVVFEYSDTVARKFGLYTPEWVTALREIDAAVGRILSVLDSDTTVLLISDHGWRRYGCVIDINRWLDENGLIEWRTGLPASANVIGLTLRRSPKKMSGNSVERPLTDPNLPGSQIKELREVFERLRDPETDEPLISRVYRGVDAFHGAMRNAGPARYIIEAREHCRILYIGHQAATVMHRQIDHHSPDGIYVLAGPGIEPKHGPVASLRDIAPTVLSFYGVSAGGALTGDSLLHPHLLARSEAANSETVTSSGGVMSGPPAYEVKNGEIDIELRGTLRALGYIDSQQPVRPEPVDLRINGQTGGAAPGN